MIYDNFGIIPLYTDRATIKPVMFECFPSGGGHHCAETLAERGGAVPYAG